MPRCAASNVGMGVVEAGDNEPSEQLYRAFGYVRVGEFVPTNSEHQAIADDNRLRHIERVVYDCHVAAGQNQVDGFSII